MLTPAAEPSDALQDVRSLAATGTPRLALDLAVKAQPADPRAPGWADWEALRCSLLTRLKRSQELLERADHLPPGVAAPALHECLMPATRAAVAAGRGTAARKYAARLLWHGSPTAADARVIRLLVIDSYVADKRGDDAYHGMLRFDLDHRPIERATAARFVSALLDLGMAKQAVNWLAHLDDTDPLKLRLRLQAALIEPEAAARLARKLAARTASGGWWDVIALSARMQSSRLVEIEALEQLLQLSEMPDPSRQERVRALWQAYHAAARDAAVQNHLLDDDDAGWGAFAASRAGNEPAIARAVFAHLARHASAPAARSNAQLQLELSLQLAKLDLAAVQLFSDASIDVASLDPRLRHSLGAVAEARGLPAAAARMWQGLEPQAGANAVGWRLRLAAVMVRAGQTEAGAALVRHATSADDPWSPEVAKRASALAHELLNGGHAAAAQPLLTGLVHRSEGLERRQYLFELGHAYEAEGKWSIAAEHYLRGAALAEPNAPDALARQARLAAGLSLARAGYRDDARAQFEWMLRHSRDPAQLAVARRELKKL